MRLDRALILAGAALLLVVLAVAALATVPPTVAGGWIKLSLCTRAKDEPGHKATLLRLGSLGEVWLRERVIVYAEDDPEAPGCAKVGNGMGKTFLIKGTADELVRLLP